MGDTKIPWATKGWPITEGCTKCDAECRECYATFLAYRFSQNPNEKVSKPCEGVTFDAHTWTGKVNTVPERLDQPIRWQKPARIFVCPRSDFFHADVPYPFQVEAFQRMFDTPRHTYLILTKREDVMDRVVRGVLRRFGMPKMPPHIWLGVTAGTQKSCDRKLEVLVGMPCDHLFLSAEPTLEMINIQPWLPHNATWEELQAQTSPGNKRGYLSWVIAGCESGARRRPVNNYVFRWLRDQCVATDTPYFLKQMEVDGELVKMPELDGTVWEQFPEGMR